jgi:hypothetical protein
MLRIRLTILLIGTGLLIGVNGILASGTYPPAPPRLRADITKEIDPVTYNLGKLVFAGKAKLNGEPVSDALVEKNREILTDVISRVPERVRRQTSIDTLATELNQDEIDALIYYLRLRFRLAEVTN